VLTISGNVAQFYSWRQTGVISGSPIKRAKPAATAWVVNRKNCSASHARMDELPSFAQAVIGFATRFSKKA
jgi:hypothetical protein